jgi:F-type H+-transporting ATPase subunit alpha
VREVLKQREHDHIAVPEQIAALLAATEGLFDETEPNAMAEAEIKVRKAIRAETPEVCKRIAEGEKLEDEDRVALVKAMRAALTGTGSEDGDGHA